MSQLFTDDLKQFKQTDDPGMDDGAYTLGPLHAGQPCCHPRPLIRVEHLSVHYGEKPALEEITLDIYRGCITALIGPSGCGKTSFLSVLNRLTDLIPGCRVAGSVRIGATDLLHPALDVQALRREVGMIFQKPMPFPLPSAAISNCRCMNIVLQSSPSFTVLWNRSSPTSACGTK